MYLKSVESSNNLKELAYDNIRWAADSFLIQKLIQGEIFYRTQVTHSEVGIVEGVVSKRFLCYV